MDIIHNHFVDLDEAAQVLQCTEHQVIELLRNGTLPGMKPGRSWVIPRQAFVTAVNAWAYDAMFKLRPPEQEGTSPDGADVIPMPARGRGRSRTVMPSMESLGQV